MKHLEESGFEEEFTKSPRTASGIEQRPQLTNKALSTRKIRPTKLSIVRRGAMPVDDSLLGESLRFLS